MIILILMYVILGLVGILAMCLKGEVTCGDALRVAGVLIGGAVSAVVACFLMLCAASFVGLILGGLCRYLFT
jgi:hypothetical protein